MFRAFKGTDGSADGGIQVRTGRTDDDIRKGRVIAAAVIRVDDQQRIQQVCLPLREAAVCAKHIQYVLRDGIILPRIMDDKGFVVQVMHLGLIGIATEYRVLCDQVDPFQENLIHIRRIRILVEVVKGQGQHLQAVHQVPGGRPQDFIDQKVIRQFISRRQGLFEFLKLRLIRQKAEQKQEAGLLITEIAFPVFDQVVDAVTAVKKISFAWNDSTAVVAVITDYVRNSGESDADAGAVFIPEALLDVIFRIQPCGDIRVIGGLAEEACKYIVILVSGNHRLLLLCCKKFNDV